MTQFRFSLAFLMRSQAVFAFVLAWPIAVCNIGPDVLELALTSIGIVLAVIVGWRRRTTAIRRLGLVASFFGGAVAVARYSAFVAEAMRTQEPQSLDGVHPWASLDGLLSAALIVVAFPILLLILVYMLRAWTWSANDGRAGNL